tara:strand:+ start:771 stop:1049 length:279 start_codon:yes stop_codon:yes gene_type:complete
MKYICDVTNTPIDKNKNVSIEFDARDHENQLDFRTNYKTLRQRLMISEDVALYLLYIIKMGKLKQEYLIEKDNFLPTYEHIVKMQEKEALDA